MEKERERERKQNVGERNRMEGIKREKLAERKEIERKRERRQTLTEEVVLP